MPREDIPEELVEIAARLMASGEIAGEWEPDAPWSEQWRIKASVVLSAVSEAGWEPRWNVGATADEYRAVLRDCQARDRELAEARAQSEALAEALEAVNFVNPPDALRAYRSSRDRP